jgi:hypothetical protein
MTREVKERHRKNDEKGLMEMKLMRRNGLRIQERITKQTRQKIN